MRLMPATWRCPNIEAKSPKVSNRLSEKVNDPVSCPTVGMARHCGPGSWIPRNSGSPIVSEVPDHPWGRRDEAEVCYSNPTIIEDH